MGARMIWLKVTHDKYELPIMIADTAKELAALCGCSANNIYASMSHQKSKGTWSPYRTVRITNKEAEEWEGLK